MKVILLEDVKSVGKKGSLVTVSEGYAKNFLFPKKLAMEATKSNINDLELKKRSEDKKRQQELEEAQALAKKLEEKAIKVAVKTGDNGKLFGSVTNKEIGIALEEQTGIKIDKKKIILNDPIRMVGTRHVTVKLHPQVNVELTVEIIEA